MTKDPEGMAKFYQDKLGFEGYELFGRPGAAFFAIAKRGNLQIMFRYVRDGRSPRPWIPACDEEPFDVYIAVDDVDALYDDFLKSGALPSAPEQREYGMREIKVVDPEGYILRFGSDTGKSELKPFEKSKGED